MKPQGTPVVQLSPKCGTCSRTTETYRYGCSHVDCPNRPRTEWREVREGHQGYPGTLSEERITGYWPGSPFK